MEANFDSNNGLAYKNFWEEYEEVIAPKLKSIDILLKSSTFPLTISETSRILDISNDEVFTILGKFGLSSIDKSCFFIILLNGSGSICKLINRELECGSPNLYKPGDIAYIYDLDEKIIAKICKELFLSEIPENQFSSIFSKIPAKNIVY